jgi:steroid delta-isomerase-like uncharacterized protein
MNGEEEKRITREFIDGLNNNEWESMARHIGEDYTFHNHLGTLHGSDEFHQSLEGLRSAFPDLHLQLEEQMVDGDRVMNKVRITGTHEGEFAGVAGTGKHVDVPAMALYKFKDDKIVELWAQWDVFNILAQVGAKPMGPQDC